MRCNFIELFYCVPTCKVLTTLVLQTLVFIKFCLLVCFSPFYFFPNVSLPHDFYLLDERERIAGDMYFVTRKAVSEEKDLSK